MGIAAVEVSHESGAWLGLLSNRHGVADCMACRSGCRLDAGMGRRLRQHAAQHLS